MRKSTNPKQRALEPEERRVPPSDAVAARRRLQANGKPEDECTDTIGRMWAWGLLDGERFEPDLLREAGRRYAACYWHRYGPVCPSVGSYGEMTGLSSGGPRSVVIVDPDRDVLAENRFQARDAALRGLGRTVKVATDEFCVDGAGDNDPHWLIDLMMGFPGETATHRTAVVDALMEAARAATKAERRDAKALIETAERALEQRQRELRGLARFRPAAVNLRAGLVELAAIDRAEGWHRPRRDAKKVPLAA